jgi:hypothetical protein
MASVEDIRAAVRAARALAAYGVNPARNWHIEILAGHIEALAAEVGRLRAEVAARRPAGTSSTPGPVL